MKFSTNKKLSALAALLIFGIGFTGFAVYKSHQKTEDSALLVEHTRSVIEQSYNILSFSKDIQTGVRGFAMTKDTEFLTAYFPAEAVVFKNIDKLRQLTYDNAPQQARVDSLEWYMRQHINFSHRLIDIRKNDGLQPALDLVAKKEGKKYTDGLEQTLNAIVGEEHILLKHRQNLNEQSAAKFNVVSACMFGLMTLFTILFFTAVYFYVVHEEKYKQETETLNLNLQKKINEISDFKTLFESTPGLYLILKTDLTIDAASNEYLAATLTKREEILGRNLFDVFPDNPTDPHADGVSNLSASLQKVLRTKKADAMPEQKYDVRREDGTFEERFWNPLNKPVLNTEGEIAYIIHCVEEITDQKRNREKLISAAKDIKELYDKAPCGYFSVDSEISVSNINQTLLDWTGYSTEEVVGKMKFEDLLTQQSRENHLKYFDINFARFVETGFINDLEFEFRRKDGSSFPVSLNSAAVLNEKGEFVQSRSTVFDITERKKTEANLKAVNKELEAFSYSVAHDLRSPLRAITGYASMLLEDYFHVLDAEGKRLITQVNSNAKRMNTLIDELLAFSKLGRKELNKSLTDMNEIVNNVKEEFEFSTDQFVRLRINPLCPVVADVNLMKHVMSNLLSNAIKYSSKKEEPLIEVSSKQENGTVIYSVKDNGAGFDMDYADKLFGVFQRLHSNSEFEGTGLGLAIVQRIVHRHGGKVWAEGYVGKGATFYFSLPALSPSKN